MTAQRHRLRKATFIFDPAAALQHDTLLEPMVLPELYTGRAVVVRSGSTVACILHRTYGADTAQTVTPLYMSLYSCVLPAAEE